MARTAGFESSDFGGATLNPEQALACEPRFARVGATKKGTFGVHSALGLKTEYELTFPRVLPETADEGIVARYGAELRVLGTLDDMRNPFAVSEATTFSMVELFNVKGAVTVTERRLIGTGTKGTSMLGSIDARMGTQLNFSLNLPEIARVHVVRARGRRGFDDVGIRLDISNQHAQVQIRVIGRLGAGPTKVAIREVAGAIVAAACKERLRLPLDTIERERVEAVSAGRWSEDGSDIVAHIRDLDDVP